MRKFPLLLLLCAAVVAPLALGQERGMAGQDPNLEKVLADVNLQWVCAGPYHKNHGQDCVDFKAKFWPDSFFEVYQNGKVMTKQEMVRTQTQTATEHPNVPPGTGPNPEQFKLMAVYDSIALATDRTVFKGLDANGKLVTTSEANVLRMFVKIDGKWRPAGAVLSPAEKQPQ